MRSYDRNLVLTTSKCITYTRIYKRHYTLLFRWRSYSTPRIAACDACVYGRKRYAVFGRPSRGLDDGVVRRRRQRIQRCHYVRSAQEPIAKTQRVVGKSVDKVITDRLGLLFIWIFFFSEIKIFDYTIKLPFIYTIIIKARTFKR